MHAAQVVPRAQRREIGGVIGAARGAEHHVMLLQFRYDVQPGTVQRQPSRSNTASSRARRCSGRHAASAWSSIASSARSGGLDGRGCARAGAARWPARRGTAARPRARRGRRGGRSLFRTVRWHPFGDPRDRDRSGLDRARRARAAAARSRRARARAPHRRRAGARSRAARARSRPRDAPRRARAGAERARAPAPRRSGHGRTPRAAGTDPRGALDPQQRPRAARRQAEALLGIGVDAAEAEVPVQAPHDDVGEQRCDAREPARLHLHSEAQAPIELERIAIVEVVFERGDLGIGRKR